jgi:hypothetical protein
VSDAVKMLAVESAAEGAKIQQLEPGHRHRVQMDLEEEVLL